MEMCTERLQTLVIRRSKQMKSNWKVVLIAFGGVVAVVLMCVFGVYSSQNRAIAMEEQVYQGARKTKS